MKCPYCNRPVDQMRLWLDDLRPMPEDYDFHAESAIDAMFLMAKFDISFISFDHDLGDNYTGYYLAVWIENMAAKGFRPPAYRIHSANPVGAKNIDMAMKKAHETYVKKFTDLIYEG